jgi:hypothetical protein
MTRRNEQGFVLATAVIVLMVMVMLGLATFALVNGQTRNSGYQRNGEAAFDLAETALRAEAYQVQIDWPGLDSAPGFPICSWNSPQMVGCEGTALTSKLQAANAGVDYGHATWTAQVLDDGPAGGTANPNYFNPSLASSGTTPAYDANQDGHLWIRAQATINGQTSTLVEQMLHQDTVLTVPDNTVTAGAVFTGNNGQGTLIGALDHATGITGNVDVRCGTPTTVPSQGQGNCLGWSATKSQLSPPGAYQAGYTDPNGNGATLTQDQINQLIQTAQENNTYYAAGTPQGPCPPLGASGIVVVANAAGCSFSGNATWNSATAPGTLLVLTGSIKLTGTQTFYGVIYMRNQGGATLPCTTAALNATPTLEVTGNVTVSGALFVDGCGVVEIGESGGGGGNNATGNLTFSAGGLHGLYAADAAAPAQNTFRIIPNK